MRRVLAVLVLALAAAACGQADADPLTTPTTTSTLPPATTSTTTVPPTTSTASPAVADYQTLVDEFAADAADTMERGGIVVAITDGDDLFAAAAGVQPDGTAVPADGAWRIGSVTKPFVAALVLQLVDEGLIDLDTPVSVYLPDAAIPVSVTVRDILGHTSGIFNYTEDIGFIPESVADPQRAWEPVELVDRALALREVPENPQWAYSNTNYLVAGLLVEAVAEVPVHEALRTRVLEPLGLDATYLAGAESGVAPISSTLSWAGEDLIVDESLPYTSIETGAWTAGALISDAADLRTFLRALFAGDLIDESSLAAMTTVGAEGYGLGISRFAEIPSDVWGHGGSIPGYLTTVAYSPERDVAVIVGIVANDVPPSLERRFDDLLVAAIAG